MKKFSIASLLLLTLCLTACPSSRKPDTIDPSITITSPTDNTTVETATITLTGTATDNRRVRTLTLEINDNDAQDITESLNDDVFSQEITLVEGENAITVTAEDAAGNSSSSNVVITFNAPDTIDPTVTITSPTNNTTVNTATLNVTGTANDDVAVASLTLQVNDDAIQDITNSLQSGTFTQQVNLNEGENTITVTAEDAAGNSSSSSVTVNAELGATITGHVWFDANANGIQDNSEPDLANHTVFLDSNNNQILDEDETRTQTNNTGDYVFGNLVEGQSYNVNQILGFGQSFSNDSIATSTQTPITRTIANGRGSTRIVGGIETSIDKFPFMLALGFSNGTIFNRFCGATLISNKFALTAAHCVEDTSVGGTVALSVLAETNNVADRSGTIIKVSNIIIHPEFVNTNLGYDVAVLELAERVDLSDSNYTVELIDSSTIEFTSPDTIATTTGWGTLASGGSSPAELQVVHTKIVNAALCENTYAELYTLGNFETQICAGVPEGGVDGCQGDSGGPLFVRGTLNGQPRWLHAGATSWGQGCGFPDYPGIWARTSALQPWIIQQAVERSSSIITNSGDSADFGNQPSVRPMVGEIPARWQATNFSLDNEGDNGFFVEPNVDLTFTWNIFAEETADYTYSCDITVANPEGGEETSSIPCGLGQSTYTLAGGISEGQRTISLEISASDGTTHTRERRAGLLANSITGELTSSDPVDPDYSSTYYVDYFDVNDIAAGETVTLFLETIDFAPYIALYDKDGRNGETGGGFIDENSNSLTFTVAEDTTYLIGVSTNGEAQTGSYTLLTSNGTLESFIFPTPVLPE